jgi:uncharacterized protein YbbC (DUF1343 family)/CubicO group peptidase (beta-lactamase class C family)
VKRINSLGRVSRSVCLAGFCIAALVWTAGCAQTTSPPARQAPSPRAPSPATPSAASSRPAPPDLARVRQADAVVQSAIDAGSCPGAVLLVGRGQRTGGDALLRQAYGNRAVVPAVEAMTVDTIFDLASLTKPIATATCVMILVDRGLVDVDAPVVRYLPEFTGKGKERITVSHLLLHVGGLIADNAMADYTQGGERAWQNICDLPLRSEPGTAFTYTDVGYIVLGKLVERVAGRPLNQFAEDELFKPLQMTDTGFLPPAAKVGRIAPTDERGGRIIRGDVHDPRAFAMVGVAGHAGLFGTADDLARYARMILAGGVLDGRRILKTATVKQMITPRTIADGSLARTFGFDCDTAYSGPRGLRYPRRASFGHTGFTGTSIWIDPGSDSFVILLTSSVHPAGKGDVRALRRQIGTLAGEAFLGTQPATAPAAADGIPLVAPKQSAASPSVLPGIDVLESRKFDLLQSKRVALITNHSGLTADGRRTVDVLRNAPGVSLTRLFSPEHGLFGIVDEKVADAIDPTTGLKVHSLYGQRRKPTPEMLEGIDVVVFDIQDAGARYYTYIATMGLCMQACADAKVKFVVLDRPNPVTGTIVDGPPADADTLGFTAFAPIPISHGMTAGEMAKYFVSERGIACELEVVQCTGWRRGDWYDQTGLLWVNPSPNLRNLNQALLYLGVGQIEFTNVSVGRGTDEPFSTVGAPWVDGRRLADALNRENLPGLRFTPITFTPSASKFAGERCQGVYIAITDRAAVKPVRLGVALAFHLRSLFGEKFEIAKVHTLMKHKATLERLKTARSAADVWTAWEADVAAFMTIRQKYLIYPK